MRSLRLLQKPPKCASSGRMTSSSPCAMHAGIVAGGHFVVFGSWLVIPEADPRQVDGPPLTNRKRRLHRRGDRAPHIIAAVIRDFGVHASP